MPESWPAAWPLCSPSIIPEGLFHACWECLTAPAAPQLHVIHNLTAAPGRRSRSGEAIPLFDNIPLRRVDVVDGGEVCLGHQQDMNRRHGNRTLRTSTSRFDALNQSMNQRFDGLERRMDQLHTDIPRCAIGCCGSLTQRQRGLREPVGVKCEGARYDRATRVRPLLSDD